MSAAIEAKLAQHGLLTEGKAVHSTAAGTAWYINLLMGFAGWLAAVFLFGFLGLAFADLLESMLACALLGSLLIVLAYFILRHNDGPFWQQLSLAVSLSGQALICVAVFEWFDQHNWQPWLALLSLQLLVVWLMPPFVHRLFAALFAGFCVFLLWRSLGLAELSRTLLMLSSAWLCLHEFSLARWRSHILPLSYGLLMALVLLYIDGTFGQILWYWHETETLSVLARLTWLNELLDLAVLLYVTSALFTRYGQPLNSLYALAGLAFCGLVALCSIKIAALDISLLILVLAFAASNRMLLALGSISLLWFVGQYYYTLELSLLQKSAWLLLLSILLLSSAWLIRHFLPVKKESTDA